MIEVSGKERITQKQLGETFTKTPVAEKESVRACNKTHRLETFSTRKI